MILMSLNLHLLRISSFDQSVHEAGKKSGRTVAEACRPASGPARSRG